MDEQGQEHVYRVLPHPGSVGIVAVRDGRIALIRQMRPAVDEAIWEIPAGTLEAEENPADCCRRELEEETGFRAGRVIQVGSFYLAPEYSSERMHLFLAENLAETQVNRDPGEMIQDLAWYTPDEIRGMIKSEEIVDVKTVAALMYIDLT